jgi:hypothetical protein
MSALGPFCQSAGISTTSLEDPETEKLPELGVVTNGIALELKNYADTNSWTIQRYLVILAKIDPNFASVVNLSSVTSKINTVKEQKKKLTSKKKVKGVKNVNELLARQFSAPIQRKDSCQNTQNEQDSLKVKDVPKNANCEQETDIPNVQSPVFPNVQSPVFCTREVQTEHETDISELNVLKYKVRVQERRLKQLSNKVSEKKCTLENLNKTVGHYSVKNVNKRDANSRKNLHALRETHRQLLKQQKIVKSQQQHSSTRSDLQKEISALKSQLETLKDCYETEKEKKLSVQKKNSYLKSEISRLRAQEVLKCDCISLYDSENENVQKLKLELTERELIIAELEEDIKSLKNEHLVTKNEHGYTENTRLCIMELAGLECAVEKMSPVIQTVAKHIFDKHITKEDLPNATTCQTIVDEGHFIAKAYIANRIDHSSSWGLGRDGTTRRKQKIVDTAITLDSGENISLGFTRVAKENSDTIQKVTEEQLNELSTINNDPEYLTETLSKLAFTMSDRAANEKKADQLLDEWREQMLKDYGGSIDDVHHFHCMAHVLLGLHNYIIPNLKEHEHELERENGPIGRNSLSYFNSWSKKESVVNRVVRTTSDTFGPAGDHLGVRDRWEAYCSEHGIKSLIGNYRDNRFNALFQTSAEVFMHREEFIKVLGTVSKPNMKLKAVKSDLESNDVCSLLQCLGLYYIKLTGPYWNMITNGSVNYFELSTHIKDIEKFLTTCEENPKHLLVRNEHWASTDPLDISLVPHYDKLADKLFEINDDTKDKLLTVIPIVASGMLKCVRKQLADFLQGGKFEKVSADHQKHATFAPVTNLSCEHHFGDLDSSQRRRPHASNHHHSSIQMLKRNRTQISEWLSGMDREIKSELLKSARKGGKELRRKHQENEKNVLTEIHESMMLEVQNKGKKRKNNDCVNSNKSQRCEDTFKEIESVSVNDYVAVAYQDNWYPGIVEKLTDIDTVVVKFMAPCKKSGVFQWPARDDRQLVKKEFILCKNIVPDCINSGRQWFVKEHSDISNVYSKFYAMYF